MSFVSATSWLKGSCRMQNPVLVFLHVFGKARQGMGTKSAISALPDERKRERERRTRRQGVWGCCPLLRLHSFSRKRISHNKHHMFMSVGSGPFVLDPCNTFEGDCSIGRQVKNNSQQSKLSWWELISNGRLWFYNQHDIVNWEFTFWSVWQFIIKVKIT